MSVIAFDTHKVFKRLRGAGFSEEQAEALTTAIQDATTVDLPPLATTVELHRVEADLKTELKTVESDLKTDLQRIESGLKVKIEAARLISKADLEVAKAEILKWMFGSVLALAGLFFGAVFTFAKLMAPH